jgi:molecular chaperone DnaK
MTPQGQPLNMDVRFDRKLLEALTQHLVDRSLKIMGGVMVDAGISVKDIDEIMLVGGQTRMPIIQERLTRFFGKAPSKGVHPDEAVGIGAALYGWSLQESSDLKLQLLDVIPMAIGIEQAGGDMHVVFPRNAAIPNARTIAATNAVDRQSELAMRIYQGDHARSAENELLGEFTFSGVRSGRAGDVRLEILFEVNVEGSSHVGPRPRLGRQMKTTVRVSTH